MKKKEIINTPISVTELLAVQISNFLQQPFTQLRSSSNTQACSTFVTTGLTEASSLALLNTQSMYAVNE
jgi:hypothetical protein